MTAENRNVPSGNLEFLKISGAQAREQDRPGRPVSNPAGIEAVNSPPWRAKRQWRMTVEAQQPYLHRCSLLPVLNDGMSHPVDAVRW